MRGQVLRENCRLLRSIDPVAHPHLVKVIANVEWAPKFNENDPSITSRVP